MREKKTLLLVDDDESFLRVWGYILEKKGYAVYLCRSAAEAINRLEQTEPDLILCDIYMKGIDGFQLCEELRERALFDKVPLVFITGRANGPMKERGRALGGHAFLEKPFALEDVVDTVEAILAHRKARDNDEQVQ